MRYLLPVVIPLVDTLPSRVDLHRAVQIQINDQWLLVDATHDAPLGRGGLTVAQWDGLTPTPPAYDQVGPILVEGAHDADIGIVLAEIAAWTESCDFQLLRDWQDAYIDWLTAIRGTDSLEST
jgi:transglutaminase-like putative cysteine protease